MQVTFTDESGRRHTVTDQHPLYKAHLAKQQGQTRTLKNLRLDRVDFVTAGANQGAKVALVKAEEVPPPKQKKQKQKRKVAKAVETTSKPADLTVNDAAHRPTTPVGTLDGAKLPTDTDSGEGQSADIGPGPDPLGVVVRRLDDMVRRGVIDQPTASAMYTKQKLAMAHSEASSPYWTQSDSVGIGKKGYLSAAEAKENVSRPVDGVAVTKALREREGVYARPLTKTQGLLIAARVTKGLSQSQAARESGLSRSLISMIESGQMTVSGSAALRLSEAYGLSGADALLWARAVSRPKPEA